MSNYSEYSKDNLQLELIKLNDEYNNFKSQNLKLDMSRGKHSLEQTELSNEMFDILNSSSNFETKDGIDCRNYGLLDGIPQIKKLFADLMDVDQDEVFVGGNSSLNLMFDVFTHFMTHGIAGEKPWFGRDVKFLCPVPGYDRHFSITEYYNVKMINIPMTRTGPDMDMVENLVSSDESIKGIWCVPKYSNPDGITYSDETVKRFARLKPKAKDFRIMWDNAYCIHDLSDEPDKLLSLMSECKKVGNEDIAIFFCSTSKITFPGSGVAALAASKANMDEIKKRYSIQTIGFDKLNQLRHDRFFENMGALKKHMAKHRAIIEPKFQVVLDALNKEFSDNNIVSWNTPKGGYFISVNLMDGCAKRVVELCKNAGVILTSAGATYPYKVDPKDSNIRLAPTYPSLDELELAIKLFCLCVKIASLEKLLNL